MVLAEPPCLAAAVVVSAPPCLTAAVVTGHRRPTIVVIIGWSDESADVESVLLLPAVLGAAKGPIGSVIGRVVEEQTYQRIRLMIPVSWCTVS